MYLFVIIDQNFQFDNRFIDTVIMFGTGHWCYSLDLDLNILIYTGFNPYSNAKEPDWFLQPLEQQQQMVQLFVEYDTQVSAQKAYLRHLVVVGDQ